MAKVSATCDHCGCVSDVSDTQLEDDGNVLCDECIEWLFESREFDDPIREDDDDDEEDDDDGW